MHRSSMGDNTHDLRTGRVFGWLPGCRVPVFGWLQVLCVRRRGRTRKGSDHSGIACECQECTGVACRVANLTTEFERQLGVREAKLKEVRAAVRHANRVRARPCAV